MPDLLAWFTDHESALSGIAALIAIVAAIVVILSPLGTGVRGLLFRSNKADSDGSDRQTDEATLPAPQGFLNTPPPLITDKPSIAVLPFVNMSDDKSQEYFADGMTEDIITGLSCDSRLFVIARNSTFAYKGQSPDIRTVGKELGVRYVLEGSIRPVADRLRITVQLIETETGSHIWADKIDRPVADIFDIQDEVVDSLVATLCTNLGVAESQRAARARPENLQAWALCIQADVLYNTDPDVNNIREAEKLAQRAANIEPDYAISWALLSLLASVPMAWGRSTNLPKDSEKVMALVNKALRLAPKDPVVLGYCGFAATWAGHAAEAVNYLERSLALNPGSNSSRLYYGSALWTDGRPEDGCAQLKMFIRRSPNDPYIGHAYFFLSFCFLTLNDMQQAEQAARECVKHSPSFGWGYVVLASALKALDREGEAKQQMLKVKQLEPGWTYLQNEAFFNHIFRKPEQAALLNALLRQVWGD
ncbi:MAG: hypothetical protein V7717_06215 [Porticoccaceae bacterium]